MVIFQFAMLIYQRLIHVIEGHHPEYSRLLITNHYLVGGFNHLEKYEFVNGKDDIPYIMEKCLKPPTR